MPKAVEHIRRMRGGAQSHLMRCNDGYYYVVKFQNNPQHKRVLVNELLGSRLAGWVGLPTAPVAVVEVNEELIRLTADLEIQLGTGKQRCTPGLQFGSRYPGDPARQVAYDFLPDEQMLRVANLADFAGMLVFDKWTCNANGRQAIFFRLDGQSQYQAWMVDHGFCFNAGEWNFPDAPLRGLYVRGMVYGHIRGWDAFEPWLGRVERGITSAQFDEAVKEIPPEWYDFDLDCLARLVERLDHRRRLVRELILEARQSYRQPFPYWK